MKELSTITREYFSEDIQKTSGIKDSVMNWVEDTDWFKEKKKEYIADAAKKYLPYIASAVAGGTAGAGLAGEGSRLQGGLSGAALAPALYYLFDQSTQTQKEEAPTSPAYSVATSPVTHYGVPGALLTRRGLKMWKAKGPLEEHVKQLQLQNEGRFSGKTMPDQDTYLSRRMEDLPENERRFFDPRGSQPSVKKGIREWSEGENYGRKALGLEGGGKKVQRGMSKGVEWLKKIPGLYRASKAF